MKDDVHAANMSIYELNNFKGVQKVDYLKSAEVLEILVLISL